MRLINPFILKDLKKKMVFISGPRQCGKTTLAKDILKQTSSGLYLNWDDPDQRKTIFTRNWSDHQKLLILDELHKFPKWKNWLKGTYDTQKEIHQFIVTGSARLETFRKGGDSLLGRYHLWHLHPFSLCEKPEKLSLDETLNRLMTCGGFPEPFLDHDVREARRWRRERFEKVIKEDIRELENIQDLQTLGLLVDLLRSRVGSTIVVSNLAEDLQKSPVTIKKWIDLLEAMFVIFKVKVYTHNLARSVQKPFKVFFYDNADVEGDEGAVFENLVATHLLKQIQLAQDYEGHRFELAFVRDKEQREVDFIILKNKKPFELVEAKWGSTEISKHLRYYAERLHPERARQITQLKDFKFKKGLLEITDVRTALSNPRYYFDA